MAKDYIVALDLKNKPVLVVGGGNVAERKVKSLLKVGAEVTIVSPELTPELEELVSKDLVSCEYRNYQTEDVKDKFLVVGATNLPSVNKKVAEDGLAKNLLVNIIDQPELSNFNVTAVVKRGPLCLSVSTNGKSPALSRKIRKDLGEEFGSEYDLFLELMGEIRREVIERVKQERDRKEIFRNLVYSEVIDHLQNEDYQQAEEVINNLLPSEMKVKLDTEEFRIEEATDEE